MPAKYFAPTLQPYHSFLFGFLNEWKFSFAYLSNFEPLQEDMPGIKENNFTGRVELYPAAGIEFIISYRWYQIYRLVSFENIEQGHYLCYSRPKPCYHFQCDR